jgi:hypothetical protein
VDHTPRAHRNLCIVSRDPLKCSELVLSLQASVEPDDEVEIMMDRRRECRFEASATELQQLPVERRKNLHVDLEVKTKGFAIVPKAPVTSRPPAETDSDDRARFENILSFRRKRESRPRRGVGAAGAVMVALVLAPPVGGLSDRVPDDAPSSSGATKPTPAPPASTAGQSPSGAARAPVVSSPPSNAEPPGNASRGRGESHRPTDEQSAAGEGQARRDRKVRGASRGGHRTLRVEGEGSHRPRQE